MTQSYIPAPKITLTGTTIDVRFDTAGVLYGSAFSGAYVDTLSRDIQGAFYIKNIGWTLMSSGAYQVRLDCGMQTLATLSTSCQFTGSGWSENIGEVGFANIRYNPSFGTLSGSLSSFAGEFDMSGISLPLLPVTLTESLTGMVVDHAKQLHVQGSSMYGDGSWFFRIIPSKNTTYTKTFSSTDGIFMADLSLADTYTLKVEDPQGSVTQFSGVPILPDVPALVLDSTPSPFIEEFCARNSSACEDIYPRMPTRFDRTGTDIVGDGSSAYDFSIKIRDRYGNWVNTGSIDIVYSGSVQAIDLPENILSTNPAYFGMNNPLSYSSPSSLTIDGYNNTLETSNLGATPTLEYSIRSLAPTNPTRPLRMEHLTYTPPFGATIDLTDMNPVVFLAPYGIGLVPPDPVVISSANSFSGTFSSQTSVSLNPEIIHLFTIGEGMFAKFTDLASVPSGVANDSDMSWIVGVAPSTSSLTLSASLLASTYALSGIYMPLTAYPELEDLHYATLIHYHTGGMDIIYPAITGQKSSEFQASHVKILGQNNARSEYGTIATTSRARTDFFNTLRKNISLLSRNRTNYTDANYSVFSAATTVDNASFASKRTIVVIGADVTITEDISKQDVPVAIIALADKNGNGGNIRIDPSVTQINAGLFAEHSMLTSGNSQLVIY